MTVCIAKASEVVQGIFHETTSMSNGGAMLCCQGLGPVLSLRKHGRTILDGHRRPWEKWGIYLSHLPLQLFRRAMVADRRLEDSSREAL